MWDLKLWNRKKKNMEKCFKAVSLGKGFWLLFYRSPNLLDIKAEYPDKITSNGKMSAQQRNLSTDKHWVGGRVCKLYVWQGAGV